MINILAKLTKIALLHFNIRIGFNFYRFQIYYYPDDGEMKQNEKHYVKIPDQNSYLKISNFVLWNRP